MVAFVGCYHVGSIIRFEGTYCLFGWLKSESPFPEIRQTHRFYRFEVTQRRMSFVGFICFACIPAYLHFRQLHPRAETYLWMLRDCCHVEIEAAQVCYLKESVLSLLLSTVDYI